MAIAMIFSFTACGDTPDKPDDSDNKQEQDGGKEDDGKEDDGKEDDKKDPSTNLKPTVYLAGDSTVKTYADAQYIAGWGQYLADFLDGMTVANAAQGGRSSRSFINEGRLYDIDDPSYTYKFSENGGKSIGSMIKEGDFLFIQFGHNDDDTKKQSSYSTMFDRMVPLGTPDANGVYPVTAPTAKADKTHLPDEYVQNSTSSEQSSALTEIAKYGATYYSYDCGGTYKWYLKQYIDFAREKGAIPVLVTPVARVKFSGNEIIGGPGLHGDNFAYVQAVRQLASEEDCLLIDLFNETKKLLETATSEFANYLMALVPNDLNNGPWPTGYDTAYGNTDVGFTKIEGTHYNKYGAYLTAAKLAENIIAAKTNKVSHKGGKEYFTFADNVKTTPSKYIDPSNLISKTKVTALEGLFTTVNPTNPNRTYPDPATVVAKIAEVCTGEVTGDNYLTYQEKCNDALAAYYNLNVDDRSAVTNYNLLLQYIEKVEEQIEAHRPKASRVVVFDPSSLTAEKLETAKTATVKEVYGEGSDKTGETGATVDFKIVGASGKAVDVKSGSANFTYNGNNYSVTKYLSMGGSATFGTSRYVEFTTTAACRITVVAKSTGSDDRTLKLVNASSTGTVVTTFDAPTSQAVTSQDLTEAGTYQIGSAGSGIYIYAIIIEYYS